jgi:quercetin 2,3-dioxygenase
MSGPDLLEGRAAVVGGLPVTRLLPKRAHRTVGAWCFADHMGPADAAMQVGPHPHIGLSTVTWLLEGEALHRDSLGSEQLIRPGQLNLMTAGNGVSHAEEAGRQALHGMQLWVAQPEATRHGAPAFEHHAELPQAEVAGATATVLVGQLAGVRSPARADTPLVGADLVVRDRAALALDPSFEHVLLPMAGELRADGVDVALGGSAYLAPGRAELTLDGDGRVLLLGGEPFESAIAMSWNFVARTADELQRAHADWAAADGRFGTVDSELPRIPAPS